MSSVTTSDTHTHQKLEHLAEESAFQRHRLKIDSSRSTACLFLQLVIGLHMIYCLPFSSAHRQRVHIYLFMKYDF